MRRSFARDLPIHPVLRLFLLTFDPLRYVSAGRDAQSDFAVRVTIGSVDSIENCGLYMEARRREYDVAPCLHYCSGVSRVRIDNICEIHLIRITAHIHARIIPRSAGL